MNMSGNNKNCKVISTYFGPRRCADLSGTFTQLKNQISNEIDLVNGVPCDVIVVNHHNDFNLPFREEFYSFLEEIDGSSTRDGVIKVIHRDFQNGIGGSFASFNYAFEKFHNEYEYWFFTEDTVMAIADNLFKECIKQIIADDEIAFVGVARKRSGRKCSINSNLRVPPHCHGGCGVSHISKLMKAFEQNGHLPYCKKEWSQNMLEQIKENGKINFNKRSDGARWYRRFELEGEVMFTNIYYQMGYKLVYSNVKGHIVKYSHFFDDNEDKMLW